MRKTTLVISTALAASLLGACASSPTTPPELLQARSNVALAERDSNVLSYAPLELKKATDALARANALSAKGEALAEVSSAAYVADTQARTALALAKAKRDEQAIKGAETERVRARADADREQADRARAQAADSRFDAQSARADASVAQQQAANAQQEAALATAVAIDARQEALQLQQQLSDMKAQASDRGMLVTLGDVLFEFGKAEIKDSARGSLVKLAAYLQAHPERRVLIEGYTDSVGTPSANLILSQRRAESVASALAGLNVAQGRIATMGYGNGYPVSDNATDTNRALNRRVEVYISNNDQPVRARS